MCIKDDNANNVFYTVVVVFNMSVNDSITIENLKGIKAHTINIIVVDNSVKEFNNKDICRVNNWSYISMNGNAGLSKAYNAALDYLKNKQGMVIWFDDDTDVTQEYFDELGKSTYRYLDCDIFVPIIQGQDGKFWSPNEYHYLRNKQLKNIYQEINDKRFNAINSCAAVRLSVYENYRYTEKLFLDQVDHQFFEDQRRMNRKFKKMDIVIHHNFSIKGRMKSIEDVKNRYAIMIPDFLIFCSKTTLRYILGWIKIICWGIKESFRYKNIKFFIWCIKTTLKESKNIKEKSNFIEG